MSGVEHLDGQTGGGCRDRRWAAWRPAGLIYLGVCVASLAAGLYPQAIYPSRRDILPAPLPALQTLLVGQTLFILLVHPLILLARTQPESPGRYWRRTVAESAVWLAATAPLYVAAAWLANAEAGDVIRAAAWLACLWPVAWAAGWLLRARPAARTAVVLALLLAAAMPAGYYVVLEFLRPWPTGWLWQLAPATFAWQIARSRAGTLLPQPAWAVLIWPAIAAAASAGSLLRRSRPGATN